MVFKGFLLSGFSPENSFVEAAGGKSQRKIGGVEITQAARNSFRYTPPSAIAVSDGARQNQACET